MIYDTNAVLFCCRFDVTLTIQKFRASKILFIVFQQGCINWIYNV